MDSTKFKTISIIRFADFADATIITDRLEERAYLKAGDIIEVMGGERVK